MATQGQQNSVPKPAGAKDTSAQSAAPKQNGPSSHSAQPKNQPKPQRTNAQQTQQQQQPGAQPQTQAPTQSANPQPKEQRERANRGSTNTSANPNQAPAATASNTSSTNNIDLDMDDAEKRFGRYPDVQQVFVGNLSPDISETELKQFFGLYGKVLEVRINTNTKQQSGRRLPNYGFVVFEEKKSVDALLGSSKSNNLTYKNEKGEFRLNVEEKRARQGRQSGFGGGSGGGKSNRATRSSSNGSRGNQTNGGGSGNVNKKFTNTHSNKEGHDNSVVVEGGGGGGGNRESGGHRSAKNNNYIRKS